MKIPIENSENIELNSKNNFEPTDDELKLIEKEIEKLIN
tara:strand:+ start:5980 stop:6096 length:117 start_codon:yes stop_codon:yes gene_type:complete